MEQRDFLEKEAIRTPEKELEVRMLIEQYRAAMTKNAALKDEVAELKEQLSQLKKVIYGQKSEKSEVVLEGAEQVPMFDEAEQESIINPKNLQTTEVKAHKRTKSTRDELNPSLPVEEVFHEVEDKTCDQCGSEMTVIGKEKLRDKLVYVPARLFLRRHVAEVVKCTSCVMDETRDADLPAIEKCHIRTADVPAPMIPHSFVSPELLAHIVYEKYCNAMPLYRLEKDFTAKGANISRTTMANWIITTVQLWLKACMGTDAQGTGDIQRNSCG